MNSPPIETPTGISPEREREISEYRRRENKRLRATVEALERHRQQLELTLALVAEIAASGDTEVALALISIAETTARALTSPVTV